MTTPTVGFVGLGHMGEPMAARVASAYPLVAYDLDANAGAGLTGVRRVEEPAELARSADVVCLSVPVGEASVGVIEDLTAVRDARATLIVELSTIGPTWTDHCVQRAREARWRYVDAPVSGGRRGATAGTLSVMVAGDDEDVATSMPILRRIADKQFVVGKRPGLGQVMKLTNNAIALSVLPLTSEALAFGASYGLELRNMIDVINASSGRTQRSETMFPTSILTKQFDHGAEGEITQKDMALYVEEAERIGNRVDIATVVADAYKSFVEAHPRTDYSYLHEFITNSCRKD